jgi:hypothetical protein
MVNVVLTPTVTNLLKERGITEADVRAVVDYAETTKDKAIQPSTKLNWGVKRIGNSTVNVIYKDNGEVTTAFSYKVALKNISDYVPEDKTDWVYAKTNEQMYRIRADMEYIGVTRAASAYGCKSAPNTAFIEEFMAMKTIAIAQMLLEKKKGA